jgi:Mg-chelatase subunit ChlD
MPRKKQTKLSKFVKALGGLGSIVAIILALVSIVQNERERVEQNNVFATQNAIQLEGLRILGEAASPSDSNSSPQEILVTQTALSYQVQNLSLTQQALEQSVDASPQKYFDFVMLFDKSGSMERSQTSFDEIAQQIIEVTKNDDANNRIGVATFGDHFAIQQNLTNDFDAVLLSLQEVANSEFSSSTFLFEGLYGAYSMIVNEGRPNTQQAVIVFTDGRDTRSTNLEYNNSIRRLIDFNAQAKIDLMFVVPGKYDLEIPDLTEYLRNLGEEAGAKSVQIFTAQSFEIEDFISYMKR